MAGGAFTDSLDVDIGDPTEAADHDKVADNTEFNREKGDVDHNFDISTGDGHHYCQEGSSNKPLHLKYKDNGGSNQTVTLGLWEATDGSKWLLVNAAAAAFNRADAEAYIPILDIADVPAS